MKKDVIFILSFASIALCVALFVAGDAGAQAQPGWSPISPFVSPQKWVLHEPPIVVFVPEEQQQGQQQVITAPPILATVMPEPKFGQCGMPKER